jgi:hypothetical protein
LSTHADPPSLDVRSFLLLHLISKFGSAAHDAATALKVVEKGLGKEDFALAVLTDFPIQIIFGYLVARWSRGDRPLRPWIWAYWPRYLFAFLSAVILWNFPAPPITTGFFIFLVMFRSLAEMARFVPADEGVARVVKSNYYYLQHDTIYLYWCVPCTDLRPDNWRDVHHSLYLLYSIDHVSPVEY